MIREYIRTALNLLMIAASIAAFIFAFTWMGKLTQTSEWQKSSQYNEFDVNREWEIVETGPNPIDVDSTEITN